MKHKPKLDLTQVTAYKVNALDGDDTKIHPKWLIDASMHQLATVGTHGGLQFTTDEGVIPIGSEDYIVRLSNGNVIGMPSAVFQALFMPDYAEEANKKDE